MIEKNMLEGGKRMNSEKVTEELVQWLKEKVQQAGAKGLIIGISGGVDSAVAAMLAKRAFPENCLGVMMPCGNSLEDLLHAQLLTASCHMEDCLVDLEEIYIPFTKILEENVEVGSPEEKMARSNIKPRLRMITLYYLAQSKGYLVVGTGNKSELTVGYFTKYGDGGVDLLPLGDLSKKEIYQLADYLGVPEVICQKAPSAGLWEGQTDEQEMGFTYQQMEEYLATGKTAQDALEKIQRMEKNSVHKRNMPPIARIKREN